MPCQNELFFDDIEIKETINIYSIQGVLLLSHQNVTKKVDVELLNTGVYLLEVLNNNERYITKFVKKQLF